MQTQVVSLTVDPVALPPCTCTPPGLAKATLCSDCHDSRCAATCPLRAQGAAWRDLGTAPIFYPDNAYPGPDFARLGATNPSGLLQGASGGGEIGAFNSAGASRQMADFKTALPTALLVGVGIKVVFKS